MTDRTKTRIANAWLTFLTCCIIVALFAVVPLQIIGGFILIMIMGVLVAAFFASIVWSIRQI